MWRVSYAIITAIIGFMLFWRIFGLKENAHYAKRAQGAPHSVAAPCSCLLSQPCKHLQKLLAHVQHHGLQSCAAQVEAHMHPSDASPSDSKPFNGSPMTASCQF